MEEDFLSGFNQELFVKYKNRKGTPGFFNNSHMLFVGTAPTGMSLYKNDDWEKNKEIEESTILNSNVGEVIKKICKNTQIISYTNLIKFELENVEKIKELVKKEEIEESIEELKKQVKLLNPNLVIVFGKESIELLNCKLDEFVKIDNVYYFGMQSPEELLKITGLKAFDLIKNKLDSFFQSKALLKVTNNKIYYLGCDGQIFNYWNTEQNNFYFEKTEQESPYKSIFGDNLEKKNREGSLIVGFEGHLSKKDLFYYNNIQHIRHSSFLPTLILDIETNFCNDANNTPKEVTAIAFYSTLTNSFTIYVLKHHENQELNVEELKKHYKDLQVVIFEKEKDMLQRFIFDDLIEEKTMILTGWNIASFDLKYIMNRARVLEVPLDIRVLENLKNEKYTRHKDLIIFDSLDYYRTKGTFFNKPPKYSLDAVYKFVFNTDVGKISTDRVDKMWANNLYDLSFYNLRDVEMTKAVIYKLKFFDYGLILQSLVPQDFDNVFFNSKTIENLLHHRFWNKKVYFPTKREHKKIDFEGAIVLEPQKGIHLNVSVYDFAAMYTSIYITFNISPDTYVGSLQVVNSNPQAILDKYSTLKNIDDLIKIQNDFEISCFLPHYVKFGVLPELELDLLQKRNEMKKTRDLFQANTPEYRIYEQLQATFKEILNSIYGVSSFEKFILFDQNVSASITSVARQMLLYTKDLALQDGNKVLYGDSVDGETTSLFRYKGKEFFSTIEELPNRIDCKLFSLDKNRFVPKDRLETISFDFKSNKVVFKKVKEIISHKTNKELNLLRRRDYIISVTNDHSVFLENGEVCNGNKISKDTQLKTMRELNYKFKEKSKKLDIWEYAIKDSLHKKEHRKNKNGSYAKTCCVILKKLTKKHIYFYHKTLHKVLKLNRMIDLDFDFGKFVGMFIAEGSTTGDTAGGFRIANESFEFNNYYCKLGNKYFGKNTFRLYDHNWKIIATSAMFVSDIFRKMCGRNSGSKHLPDFILDTNKEFFEGIIRGYLDGDGTKAARNKNFMNYGGVGGKSKRLTSEVYFILKHIYNYNEQELFLSTRIDKKFFACEWCKNEYSWYNGKKRQRVYRKRPYFHIKKKYHQEYVWDLSIEDTENFIDICGGVVLHNTDSCFVSTTGANVEECIKKSYDFEHSINTNWEQFCTRFTASIAPKEKMLLKIEFEKMFSKLLLTTVKKRYFGNTVYYKKKILEKPFLSVTGFETRRDDTPIFFKNALSSAYSIFLEDKYKEKVKSLYLDCKKKIQFESVENLLIKLKYSKIEYKNVPIHVRALQNSKVELDRGETISMIYVLDKREVLHYDESLDLKFELDFDRYMEHFFITKVEMIDDSMPNYIKGQRSLFDFSEVLI
jgi:DNA polymerase elongation subunit (family B)